MKNHKEFAKLKATKQIKLTNLKVIKVQDAKKRQIKKIYEEVEKLINKCESSGKTDLGADDIERDILQSVLQLGGKLFCLSLSARQEEVESQGCPIVAGKISDKGLFIRPYQSIFGEFDIEHRKYHIEDKGIYYPLDASLNIPSAKLSYVLQDWLGAGSTELDYRESVKSINTILGLTLNATQSKSHSNLLADKVEQFYDQEELREVPVGDFICAEWDGKGVPIIKKERGDKTAESATSVAARLKRGEKRGTKKVATVSVVSHFTPKIRTGDSIIRGLFKSPLTPLKAASSPKKGAASPLKVVGGTTNNWHQDIHRRAFMGKQDIAITYGVERVKRLREAKQTPVVCLVDGGVGLEEAIKEAFAAQGLNEALLYMIIDIVHVSEYVWKAANAILGEKSKVRTDWVREVLSDILDGEIGKVIEDLKANRNKTNLSESAQKQLDKTIIYFSNHQHKMKYHLYLEKGLPVSTALVESSCGHLVKDRMERSGMRWSIEGAQNMMDVRAVKKNGDWENFMEFTLKENQKRYLKKVA